MISGYSVVLIMAPSGAPQYPKRRKMMRFSYQIGMCDPDHYLPLARAAEQAGFHGIAVSDSICYPQEASSKYPYNADGSRDFLESVPFVESLISVAAMAAVTERIRFATFVYKLAVRQAPCGGQAGTGYPDTVG